MFKVKYRIVRDTFCGYEAQIKPWWSPFWIQMGYTNTHSSIKDAADYILNHSGRPVAYLTKL